MTKTKLKKSSTKAKASKNSKKSLKSKSVHKKSFTSNLWTLKWAAIAIVALAVIGITQIDWNSNSSNLFTKEEVASEVADFQPGSVAINTPATANIGEEFTVDLTSNSTELVNAAQVELLYSSDAVQYLGVEEGASTFDVKAPVDTGEGKVIIPVGSTKPLQNEQVVAKLKFKAIRSGDFNLSLGSETKLLRAADATDVIGSIDINKIVTVSN